MGTTTQGEFEKFHKERLAQVDGVSILTSEASGGSFTEKGVCIKSFL